MQKRDGVEPLQRIFQAKHGKSAFTHGLSADDAKGALKRAMMEQETHLTAEDHRVRVDFDEFGDAFGDDEEEDLTEASGKLLGRRRRFRSLEEIQDHPPKKVATDWDEYDSDGGYMEEPPVVTNDEKEREERLRACCFLWGVVGGEEGGGGGGGGASYECVSQCTFSRSFCSLFVAKTHAGTYTPLLSFPCGPIPCRDLMRLRSFVMSSL
jgi:hypothetical protein